MSKLDILDYDIRSLLNDYNALQGVARNISAILSTEYKDLIHTKYPYADVDKVISNELRPFKEKYEALFGLVNNGLAVLRNGLELPTYNELVKLIKEKI